MGKKRKGAAPADIGATVLKAGVPDKDGNVYTEGSLFDIACRTPGAEYDPKTKTLTMKIKGAT